jgi:hypothetical protein
MKPIAALLASLVVIATSYSQNTYPWPSSGNVGIGTMDPQSKLDLGGGGGAKLRIYEDGGGDNKSGFGTDMSGASYELSAYFGSNSSGHFSMGTWNGNAYIEKMRITSSGNVGIGTTSPGATLDLGGGSSFVNGNPTYQLFSASDKTIQVRSAAQSVISLLSDANTDGAKIGGLYFGRTLGQSDAWINLIGIRGVQRGGTGTVVVGDLTVNSNTRGEIVRVMGDSGNVGFGTANPTEKLSVNGRIRAREVIVETSGWSDYKLQSLAEVEAQIKTNKHLTGVPSAQEVAEKGISVGDMQAVLLAKIEELTLHLIAQEKEQSTQRAKLEIQAAKIATLEAENAQLKR